MKPPPWIYGKSHGQVLAKYRTGVQYKGCHHINNINHINNNTTTGFQVSLRLLLLDQGTAFPLVTIGCFALECSWIIVIIIIISLSSSSSSWLSSLSSSSSSPTSSPSPK